MRVAVTIEQCWHRVPGGTATSVLGLLGGLAERPDLDVVAVAARHGEPAPPPFRPTVPTRHLPLPRRLLYEAWHGPGPLRWPPVQVATGPVDVVHATTSVIPPAGGAPLVATVHDLAFRTDPTAFTRNGRRVFERGTSLARRHARVVVVPSEASAAACRAAGFDADRVRVVPWGHTPRVVTDAAVEAARRAHRLPERYGLVVGTVEPRKNLPRLVRAWARAGGDVPLVHAGPPGWGATVSEADGDFRSIGYVEPAERDALYAGAALVAYPSLEEGFGLPVLEAMAQGAPVLTSAGTATEEVAGDTAVLVDPRDEASIAAGIERLLGDATLAADLAARGRARAAGFTWARCAEGYAAAYAEAASGS